MRAITFVTAMLILAGCSSTRHFATPGYTLPAAGGMTVVVLRPDVEVGSLGVGGVPQPNADWTAAARAALGRALVASGAAHGQRVLLLADQQGDAAQLVADYEHLHRAVAVAIADAKYGTVSLPTKHGRFDWTLGPDAARLATLAPGSDFALFLYTRDYFATGGRQAMQVAGALGCVVGLCVLPGGGEHFAYASLVELKSGDVVWFDVLQGSAGDLRTDAGARAMIDRLLRSLPTAAGAAK